MRFAKQSFFIIFYAIISLVILAGCSDGKIFREEKDGNTARVENDSQEEIIEMNLNTVFASTHHASVNAYDVWAKLVEEKTNNRVKVNLYYGGTLGGTTTVWQDIQGGVYDVGGPLPVPYFFDTELFPLTIAGLPFSLPDVSSASKVMTKFADKYGGEANKKVILMGMAPTEPYDLISIRPIKKIGDLKGLKIRVTGKADADLIKSWGAIPVSLPYEEIYSSLDKKTLDGAISPVSAIVGSSYHEVAPNLIKISEATQLLIPVMSRDFYDKLPDDLKELFDKELNPKLAELTNESYITQVAKSYSELEELVKGKGEVITPSSEELQKYKIHAKVQWEDWVEEANKRGYPGEEMLAEFKILMQEENLPLPF